MIPSGNTSVLAVLPRTVKGEPLPHINGITAGPDGSLYYTENTAIRRITAQGNVSTIVTVPALINGPSIPATDIHPYLRGLAVDAQGVMYVADNGDARVLKITPSGRITTLVQTRSPWAPTAVALFGDDLYVLEFLHTPRDVRRDWLPRVRKITANGKSTIIVTVDRMPGAR
jgi:sugar lactone lactonase YvrE